ncbi:MAG: dephospho-CoA kinase [Anaerolineae bacterium]
MGVAGLYVIGLTGNIATGKSEVLRILRDLGAYVVDADQRVHRLLRRGTPVYQQVVEAFGTGILDEAQEIDRRRLGARVFADPEALARLERIVHPAVIAEVERELREVAQRGAHRVAVVEAIKLLESGLADGLCDEVWVVHARPEQQVARLMATRGLTEEEARQRLAAQPPQEAKEARADWVVDNSGPLEATRQQIRAAWARVLQTLEEREAGRGWRSPSGGPPAPTT